MKRLPNSYVYHTGNCPICLVLEANFTNFIACRFDSQPLFAFMGNIIFNSMLLGTESCDLFSDIKSLVFGSRFI